jgi:TonB family protein
MAEIQVPRQCEHVDGDAGDWSMRWSPPRASATRARLTVASIVAAVTAITGTAPGQSVSAPLVISEFNLRGQVKKQVLPEYPTEAIQARCSGVVVAQFKIDEDGRISTLTILESPCPSIARASDEALRKWEFEPIWDGRRKVPFAGKWTFYFVAKGGKFSVFNSSDAPYVGRYPNDPPHAAKR